ncbi:hypothetical protein LTR36_010593 [Oleoguttula mirabilis]|uniref:WD40 repeat-like protein n=1 Tax=Oleoguttula mirabilis TaxID=1507867 RepID=A0AAV9JQH3_9PEZI|nr:hypothetical protein LTR36_010593 [Oleoguttula mirabilis]
MSHSTLRLTPSNSPFFKNTTPRSPVKATRNEEPGLRLSRVIGTTTTSANGFDSLPSARKFAYTAGAAAVVATVGEDLRVTQRFFRARPTLPGLGREANGVWPISPTPSEPRHRALGHVKETSLGASPLGASGRDWSESPTGRTTTAKDRVKAATSVALSPNGRWLALGETGYKPRVLIFSLADETSDAPVCVLAEHTFGVHALSFSPDSRYLASLGTVNDGFLYMWQIDDRTGIAQLHASNKCTTLINCMAWMGGSLITAGLRFVKVWRPDEDAAIDVRRTESALTPVVPKQRTETRNSEYGNSILNPKQRVLSGKNSLLGDMLEANFVSVLAISDTEALVCAETGEICSLNDIEKAQSLTCIAIVESPISAAVLDGDNNLRIAGACQEQQKMTLDGLRNADAFVRKAPRRKTLPPLKAFKGSRSTVIAMASLDNIMVELSAQDGIRLTNNAADADAISNQLAAHEDAVLGVRPVQYAALPDAAFLTFAGCGTVQIWDAEGASVATLVVPLEAFPDPYGLANELRAVTPLSDGSTLAVGDKCGNLTVLDTRSNSPLVRVRAHSAEITDICAFERSGIQLVATSSRDRTVQLFAWNGGELDLLQTMDEHAGAVTELMATKDGERLLSASADRTIVVRESLQRVDGDPSSAVFVMLRTINLKSAPTSMSLATDQTTVLVSTTDRTISKYSIKSGQAGLSFKCSDPEGGDAVIMSKICFAPSLVGNPTIVGISSSDKSVRLYSEFGTLLARDWGHTEGITDIALLAADLQTGDEKPKALQLVTVAADSTIFMWDTTPATSSRPSSTGLGIVDESTPSRPATVGPPLRKVISYSELSRFRRDTSIEEGEPGSPTASRAATQPSSPQRLRKKPSRLSVAQAPRLEPAFRSSLVEPSSRRRSLRQRSPSPPSPRNAATRKDQLRRPSLGMSLRSKSTENVANASPSTAAPSVGAATGFGSLTASTESVSRTLRAYRKKLAGSVSIDSIAPEALRELDKELKLTARVLSEKSHGKSIDEAMMARLLDQASEKIVGMLDERIKERVESEVRKSSEGSPLGVAHMGRPAVVDEQEGPADALAGALEKVLIEE